MLSHQANGQTKEHAMLAKALGVNQLLVVVNKLDLTDPPWDEGRYEAVKAEVGPFLARTGFRPKKVCSGGGGICASRVVCGCRCCIAFGCGCGPC